MIDSPTEQDLPNQNTGEQNPTPRVPQNGPREVATQQAQVKRRSNALGTLLLTCGVLAGCVELQVTPWPAAPPSSDSTPQPTARAQETSTARPRATPRPTVQTTPRPTPAPTPTPTETPLECDILPLLCDELPLGVIAGRASWFNSYGPGLYAAVHSWRWGDDRYRVRVCSTRRCVRVWVLDYCQCYVGTRRERVIDLSRDAFARLRDPSRGLAYVSVEGMR